MSEQLYWSVRKNDVLAVLIIFHMLFVLSTAQRRAHPDQPEAAVTNQPHGWANVKENVVESVVEVEISTL